MDANGDGIEDGILTAGWQHYRHRRHQQLLRGICDVGRPARRAVFADTLRAKEPVFYRLTARYQVAGNSNWNWYSTNAPYTTGNRRDFFRLSFPLKGAGLP